MKQYDGLVKGTAGVLAAAGLCLLPSWLRLVDYRPTTLAGITTLDDAVVACRSTRLSGWPLVAYAQQLVARKFAYYSTRNLWDTPARAFIYGMGYCTQYNLALKQLLDRLGFDTCAVFSLKVEVDDDPSWRMGHTWLRVTCDGQTKAVCAGRATNTPGRNGFRPRWPVWRGRGPILPLTHLGLIPFCGFVEWWGLIRGRDPGWTFHRTGD